jgi:hypothetical protein
MHKLLSGVAALALAGAALVALATPPVGAGLTFATLVTIHKVVQGTPPAGTTFTIHGTCTGGQTKNSTWDAHGNLTSSLGTNVIGGPQNSTCTVSETVNGGANSVTYACAVVTGEGASCPTNSSFTGTDVTLDSGTITVTNSFVQLPTMTLSPTSATAGQVVTVSGTGCTAGVSGGNPNTGKPVQITIGFPTPLTFTVQAASNPPGPAGAWSAPFTIPAGTPAGTYPVNALCLDPAAYPTAALTVVAAAAPRFTG